ncbi:MAG TPA: hypothetical protein VJY12_06170 [Dysgonamonadaceae bacterium]|nr:hypothetical protein [Dysgonamonadaceae bacterium]
MSETDIHSRFVLSGVPETDIHFFHLFSNKFETATGEFPGTFACV